MRLSRHALNVLLLWLTATAPLANARTRRQLLFGQQIVPAHSTESRTFSPWLVRGGSEPPAGDDDFEVTETSAADDAVDVVGVKEQRKSNAVGDPDGEGSSDDDDNNDLSDWDDLFESGEQDQQPAGMGLTQVSVEVEYVEDDNGDEEEEAGQAASGSRFVSVKSFLGQRFHRKLANNSSSNSVAGAKSRSQLLAAWQPFVYLPPTHVAGESSQ